MIRRSLTAAAHERVAAQLRAGDRTIDATAGNGHDTCFLAATVGPDGAVLAFDVQPEALRSTSARLTAAGLLQRVQLVHAGHEQLRDRTPGSWHGKVGAVMFNLGYLPGGDKQFVTQAASTVPALEQAIGLLRPGGIVSLMVYRGHPGGADEARAIEDWLAARHGKLRIERLDSPGPVLFLLQRAS